MEVCCGQVLQRKNKTTEEKKVSVLLVWCHPSVTQQPNLCQNDDVNAVFLAKIFAVAF